MNAGVTIIVPIYNVASYIEKCVRSLFEQTYPQIEYIFVDDCATDNSIEILNMLITQYPMRAPFVHIVCHEENKGLPSARNTGLQHATGKYVLHCDSDDWTHTELVECLVREAEEKEADIVFCDFYNVYIDKTVLYSQKYKNTYKEYLKSFFWRESQGSVWNKLFKRKLFVENNVKFPDGLSMQEDLRTIVQLYYYADKVVHVPIPLYYYVKSRANSITALISQKSCRLSMDYIANVRGIQEFLESKDIRDLDKDLGIVKLEAKNNLLTNADHIDVFKQWRDVFPEANQYIGVSLYPWHYKLIVSCILNGSWFIPKCWIWMKKIKKQNVTVLTVLLDFFRATSHSKQIL
ncbi:MAG: hypothetical protein K0R59_57 [Sphingobacterium sp.]|jgi:glycosyltransferase involved in cell wall biosynthesis|nr:hypothetical protein [Sphingobacterium sp.]